MTTIAFAMPYGVNLRNFFLTDWLTEMRRDLDTQLICLTGLTINHPMVAEYTDDRLSFEFLHPVMPGGGERLFNHFQRLAFLPYSDYLTCLYEKKLAAHPLLRWAIAPIWLSGLYRSTAFVNALQLARRAFFYDARYESLFGDGCIDLAVATRLFNTDEWQFLAAAQKKQIPTVAVISSWDNLYSYGYMPVKPDYVIVWNEIMKQEAIEKHAFSVDRVIVIGPPQFDLYFRLGELSPKTDYFARIGADPAKKLITFTTADILTDQPCMAALIYETVVAGHVDRQLLVRVHPQEDPTPYVDLRRHLPCVILDIPGRPSIGAPDRIFSRDDFTDLACCMGYSDVVINVCSTITLDASAIGAPTVCYRSLTPYTDKVRMKRVIDAHDADHFAPLVDGGALLIADDEPALARIVDASLADREYARHRREAVKKLMVPYCDGQTASRLGKALLALAAGKRLY